MRRPEPVKNENLESQTTESESTGAASKNFHFNKVSMSTFQSAWAWTEKRSAFWGFLPVYTPDPLLRGPRI